MEDVCQIAFRDIAQPEVLAEGRAQHMTAKGRKEFSHSNGARIMEIA